MLFVIAERPERFSCTRSGLRMMRNWTDVRVILQPSREAVWRFLQAFQTASSRQSLYSWTQPLFRVSEGLGIEVGLQYRRFRFLTKGPAVVTIFASWSTGIRL